VIRKTKSDDGNEYASLLSNEESKEESKSDSYKDRHRYEGNMTIQ